MGTLRTILALAVVFNHAWSGGMIFVGGRFAVQLFYVISGFLISYVLVQARTYPRKRDFYANRYLRLYPVYLVVALAALLANVIADSAFTDAWRASPHAARILLAGSNLLVFGQDWVMFSGVQDGSLVFAPDFYNSEVQLWHGLLVPQAWTLGVELTFYLVAPFILPNRRLIYLLLLVSLIARFAFLKMGFGYNDPWTYRFFPTELALFLLGALAHQLLAPAYRTLLGIRLTSMSTIATGFLVVLILFYFLLPIRTLYKGLFLFIAFIVLLPLAFEFQIKHHWDKKVGDLSYPLYIGHYLVIDIAKGPVAHLTGIDTLQTAIVLAVLSLLFAAFLEFTIGRKIERWRVRFKAPAKTNPC
jgi:peptidoglycan/LPS O-acetylase OafA/YrhL